MKKKNYPYWNFNIIDAEDSDNIISTNKDSSIDSLAISPDGSLLSIGDGQGVIRVFSCKDRKNPVEIESLICPLGEDGTPVTPTAIAFHPRNEYIAFGCDDNQIRLWKWSDAAPFAMLAGHTKWIDRIAISADGDFVVSGSPDLTLRIWSTKSLKNIQVIQTPDYVRSIAISNNNKFFAYGCYNNDASIFIIDK